MVSGHDGTIEPGIVYSTDNSLDHALRGSTDGDNIVVWGEKQGAWLEIASHGREDYGNCRWSASASLHYSRQTDMGTRSKVGEVSRGSSRGEFRCNNE